MTDGTAMSGAFRARAVISCEILLRMIRALTQFGVTDDLETMVIYLSVATASAGGALRDPVLIEKYGADVPLPDTLHRVVSRRAIAASTGFARETVRRKISWLASQGLLVESRNGVRTPSETLDRAQNMDLVRLLVRELEGAKDRLARYD